MDLLAFRDYLVTRTQAIAPAKTKVESHPGRFDLAEIKRYSVEAPWCGIAILGWTDFETPEADGEAEVALYFLGKRAKEHTQDQQLLIWASALPRAMKANQNLFGGPDVGRCRSIAFRNLFSTGVGNEGLSLGAITWKQNLHLGADAAPGLGSFQTLYTEFGAPGAAEGTTPSTTDLTTLEGA